MFADIVKIGRVNGSGHHYINRIKIRAITTNEETRTLTVVFDNGTSESFTHTSIEELNITVAHLVTGKE